MANYSSAFEQLDAFYGVQTPSNSGIGAPGGSTRKGPSRKSKSSHSSTPVTRTNRQNRYSQEALLQDDKAAGETPQPAREPSLGQRALDNAKKAAVDAWYGLVGQPDPNKYTNQAELERQERQQADRITARNEYMDEQNALLYATKQREKEAAKAAAEVEKRKSSPYYSELEAVRKRDAYLDEQKALVDNRKAQAVAEAEKQEKDQAARITAAREYQDEQSALLNASKQREKEAAREAKRIAKAEQKDRIAQSKAYQDEQNALLDAALGKYKPKEAPVESEEDRWEREQAARIKARDEYMDEQNALLYASQQRAKEPEGKKEPELNTDEEREQLLKAYNDAADAYEAVAGYEADGVDTSEQKAAMEAARAALRKKDEELGNGVQYYRDADRPRDYFEGWAGERAAGMTAAAGTAAELAGKKLGWDAVEEWGKGAFESAQGMQGTAQQQWADATSDLGKTGKFIANTAKAGADLALDFVENTVAPGVGTMRMYMGAAGGGALEQAGREKGGVEQRALKGLTSGLSAYFSNKLLGGVENVYGKSLVGKAIDGAMKNAPPVVTKVLKPLLNTEGVEEMLEDVLNYGADRILELDPEVQLDWNEVKTDGLVGYILGVVTNGLAGGMSYDSDTLHRIADEAIEFVESGMTIEEAAQVAMENEEQVYKANPEAERTPIRHGKEEQTGPLQGEGEASPESQRAAQETPTAERVESPGYQQKATEPSLTVPEGAPTAAQAPTASEGSGPRATAKPYEGPKLPNAQYGGETTVKVGKEKVPTHYAVVPISELTASHDLYGNQNPNYPAELQPRDRSRETSQAQAIQIGQNLNPEELEWSGTATGGAPIIRSDGVIVSGNGRTLGITYAMQNGLSEGYTQYLRDNAARFGIDPASITGDSVLVRVADGDYNWQNMAELANVSNVGSMSTTEQARVDAERLLRYPDILSKLVPNDDGDLNSRDNQDFIKDFLQTVVPTEEQGSVWTQRNGLSQTGLSRIRNAIFQLAYGDASLMARISESLDNNMKNVSNALLAVAPKVAALEIGTQNGTRYTGVREGILEGVKIFEEARRRGVDVAKVTEQIGMDYNPSAEGVYIAEFFEKNSKSGKQIRLFLNAIADVAENFGDPNQIGFFDEGTDHTFRDALEGGIANYEQESGRDIGRPDYDFYGQGTSRAEPGSSPESEGRGAAEPNANDENRSGRDGGSGEGDAERGDVNPLLPDEETAPPSSAEPEGPVETLIESAKPNTGADQNQSAEQGPMEGEFEDIPNEDGKYQYARPKNNPPRQNPNRNPQLEKRQRLSQYFTNTLTESARAQGLDPIYYSPESEAESLTNAAMKLADDAEAVLNELMRSPAWNGEMVDSAWLMEDYLTKQWIRTGDRTALTAWQRIEQAKIKGTAQGLQAVAKQSRPNAASVLNASMNLLDSLRSKKRPKTGEAWVNAEVVEQAANDVNDVAYRMAQIEANIDEYVENGMNPETARESFRDAYLDLADEINLMRNTGLFQDMPAQKRARAEKQLEKLNTKFRRMLGNQDMDYIQRFVACQAAGIAEDVQYRGKVDYGKRINTLQKLAQLTGTGTWLRNFTGNGTFGLVDLLANNSPITLAADQILSAFTGKRSTGFEMGVLSKEVRKAAWDALQRSVLEVAANIDIAEDEDSSKYDLSRMREFYSDSDLLLTRAMSRWEQWNGYMLTSSDEAFIGGTRKSSEEAIRRANEKRGYTASDAEIEETTKQVADYRTFKNRGLAANVTTGLRGVLDLAGKGGEIHRIHGVPVMRTGGFGVGTALIPYTTVPANIGIKALEFSPAGAVKGLVEMVKVGMNPDATMAQQNQAVTDFGRGFTGTALIYGLAQLMAGAAGSFFRDWEAEENKDVAAQNRAEGKRGQQLNLSMMERFANGDKDPTWRNDDETLDISSIEPLNQLMTASWLFANSENMGAKALANAVTKSAKDSFMDLPAVTALANIENTIKYTDTPEDAFQTGMSMIASTAGTVAGGFIPNPIGHIAQVMDPFERDTAANTQIGRAGNQIISRIPGARKTLPVKTDNYGNEISAGSFGTRFANTYDAFKHTQINQSDVSREVERVREETGEDHTPPRTGTKTLDFGSGKDRESVTLTADERRTFKQVTGQEYEDAMRDLMATDIYQSADAMVQSDMMNELMKFAKDTAKADYAENHDVDFDSQYDPIRELTNPAQYLGAKKAFTDANGDGQWDVVDTLLGQIGDGMSEQDRAYMREHVNKFGTLYDFAQEGVRSETVNQYDEELKALYEGEGRKAANGYDIFRVIASGNYSDHDADVFMGRQKSDGSYYSGKGRHAVYAAMRDSGYSPDVALQFWDLIDKNQDGTLSKKEFNAQIGKIPQPWRKEVEKQVKAAMDW